jgi:hypothetical protein
LFDGQHHVKLIIHNSGYTYINLLGQGQMVIADKSLEI